jgi:hypothetical protein
MTSTPKVWTTGEVVTAADLNPVAAQAAYALKPNGNLAGLTSVATARGNLGLGNGSTRNIGTTTGTVAAGDDSRMVGAMLRANNLTDVASISAARAALGIDGPSDVWAVGTTDGTVMAGDDRRVVGVLAFGAVGDGTTDDTTAIQAALDAVPAGGTVIIPGGYTFRFRSTLFIKSDTTLDGDGILSVLPVGDWVGGSPYRGMSNVNQAATDITDENITLRNITIDMSALGVQDGTEHCVRIRKARNVRIEGCNMIAGASSVALLGCDNTVEVANTYMDFDNCGSDHWDSIGHSRVVGCHIESAFPKQMVNFNPEESTALIPGRTAEGFTMTACTIVCRDGTGFNGACQIEPLLAGNTLKNVAITANIFKNSFLVMRGDIRGAVVSGNTFSDFTTENAAIYVSVRGAEVPEGVVIMGNVIRDPLTVSPAEGVIVARSPSAVVALNTITGTGYTVPAITGVGENLQQWGNHVEGAILPGRLSGGGRVYNGNDGFWGWTDTAGGVPRMRLQADDNWVWISTNAAGADRTVASIQARSTTAALRWSVPTRAQNYFYAFHAASLTATGSTSGGALALAANVNQVATVASGTGVRFPDQAFYGGEMVVINDGANALKVYPTTGTNIDALGTNVAYDLPAGSVGVWTYSHGTTWRTKSVTP